MKSKFYQEKLFENYLFWTSIQSAITKLEYCGRFIFGFTTYDCVKDEEFAHVMLDTIEAILYCENSCFIDKSEENYRNYLLMVNMPFLKNKIEWGVSIRHCWIEDNKEEIELSEGQIIIVKKNEIKDFLFALLDWIK